MRNDGGHVVDVPMLIYNMIDAQTSQKVIKLDVSEVPNLEFISSLIKKI